MLVATLLSSLFFLVMILSDAKNYYQLTVRKKKITENDSLIWTTKNGCMVPILTYTRNSVNTADLC